MNYRIATQEDLAQLSELRWDFRAEDGDEVPVVDKGEFVQTCISFLKRGLENGYHVYWLAEENQEIVAHIFVHKIDMVPRPCKLHDQFGYITNNYTKPDYRSRGIGSRLIQKVTDWAKAEDLELLIVYPSEKAVSFYERAGFSMENEVMELRLREFYSPDWNKDNK
jgi:ribosomal protein S18 acetylase RimI-like enzyme